MAKNAKLDNESVEEVKEQETPVVSDAKDKSSKKADKKKDKKKEKKESRVKKVGKTVRETTSELKKVTWPTSKEVIKKTGIVLAVVIVFAGVLLLIDYLLGLLFGLLH